MRAVSVEGLGVLAKKTQYVLRSVMTGDLLMAKAMADAIGATKRQVQIWTDAEVLICRPETNLHPGRGRQRLYDREELPVAALIAEAARFTLPIGTLGLISLAIRTEPAGKVPQGRKRGFYKRAIRGEVPSYLLIRPTDDRRFMVGWYDETGLADILRSLPAGLVINVQSTVNRIST